MNDAQLSARLLAEGDVARATWQVIASPTPSGPSDASASADPGTTPAFDCAGMIDGLTFLQSAGSAVGFASEIINGRRGAVTSAGTIDRAGVLGAEHLYSYAGDGAHQALAQVRELVVGCPDNQDGSGMTTKFSLAKAPALGDESLIVKASETLGAVASFVSNTLIVRSGSTIVILKCLPTTENDADIMMLLGAPAVKKLSEK